MTLRTHQWPFEVEPVTDCQTIRGVRFSADVKFRELIVTGPPGSGKTTLVNRIRGWPEEGYIDLAVDGWWRAQSLTLRPREMHLGMPFLGREGGLALFEPAWIDDWDRLRLDEGRIRLPPPKRFFWSVNWRARFAFEFLLPLPERILELRRERAKLGSHHVDANLDLSQIQRQVEVFAEVAAYLHRRGMRVFVREALDDSPFRIMGEQTDRQNGLSD